MSSSPDLGIADSKIDSVLVELMRPNKTDALSYVDGSAAPPLRYAHAVIDHRADENPYLQDILVGPLPVVNGTTKWEPLEYPYTRKTEGKIRNLDADTDIVYDEWLLGVSATVADITVDLWNATALGLDNDTIEIWGIDPLYQDGDRIMRWDTFWSFPLDVFDSETLLPMGLFFMSDVTGRDPSKWTVQGWYYNGVFYETTDAFRNAYWSGEVEKLGKNTDGPWAQTDQQGKIPPLDTTAPPVAVLPQGSRFNLDAENKYVEWMGWSFYIGFSRDTGMALFDIRFKGQRILYELGLQEALAHYAGMSANLLLIITVFVQAANMITRERSNAVSYGLPGYILWVRTFCFRAAQGLRLPGVRNIPQLEFLRLRDDTHSSQLDLPL